MTIQPYLFFGGRADEALAFYQTALNAEPQLLLRYAESPDPIPEGAIAPGWENKIMHLALKIGDSVVLAADGRGPDDVGFKGFSLTYTAKDVAEADRVFAALADGGSVLAPLGPTFFSPRFGMASDRFGVSWIIIVPAPSAA